MFSQLGAKLGITGRNEENLKKTVDACEQLGGTKVQLHFTIQIQNIWTPKKVAIILLISE